MNIYTCIYVTNTQISLCHYQQKLHMEGCASVVGFKDLVGKSLKLVKVDSANDHSVDAVIRQVRREARAM